MNSDKRLAGLSNSQDIVRTVGSIFGSRNAVEQMRELVGKIKGNAEALEGLKKAIAEHITALATGTTEAGASWGQQGQRVDLPALSCAERGGAQDGGLA